MKSEDPGSNPGQGTFFLLLQLFLPSKVKTPLTDIFDENEFFISSEIDGPQEILFLFRFAVIAKERRFRSV